jgi:hypothetical protein
MESDINILGSAYIYKLKQFLTVHPSMKNSLVFNIGKVLPILDFFQSVLSYVFRTA